MTTKIEATSASSNARRIRRRISRASSRFLRPGARDSQFSWPKYAGRAPDATLQAAAVYSPISKTLLTGAEAAAQPASSGPKPAVRLQRHFEVFGQHWFLTFDYSPSVVAGLRSAGAWGWLVAGLLLTASLVLYLVRARGRTLVIERLVGERTDA